MSNMVIQIIDITSSGLRTVLDGCPISASRCSCTNPSCLRTYNSPSTRAGGWADELLKTVRRPDAPHSDHRRGSDHEECRFRRRHFQGELSTTENSHVAEQGSQRKDSLTTP